MRKWFCLVGVLLLLAVASIPGAHAGEVLFQYSTFDALLGGLYDGGLTLGELKKHGNLGLGTFTALDGEMVVLDGRVYQVKVDGKVYRPPDTVTTPFATVTSFSPQKSYPLKQVGSLQELTRLLDQALPSPNFFYAVRIDGKFQRVAARSVPRQSRPYPPLAQVVEKQAVFHFQDVEGVILGFRCPSFVKGVNVPGYHLHFLTKDRTAGGHVQDAAFENLTVQVDLIRRFTMVLPKEKEFHGLDLGQDKSKELEKVEK